MLIACPLVCTEGMHEVGCLSMSYMRTAVPLIPFVGMPALNKKMSVGHMHVPIHVTESTVITGACHLNV